MSRQSPETKDAFTLMKLYNAKASGIRYTTMLAWRQKLGLEGAILKLEEMGLRPVVPDAAETPPPGPVADQGPLHSATGHASAVAVSSAPASPAPFVPVEVYRCARSLRRPS